MKELNQIALLKGLFDSMKGHPCLTLGQSRRAGGGRIPPNRTLFLISFILY